MKRFLCAILAAVILLTGCGKAQENTAVDQVKKPFESQLNIKYGDIIATAYISREDPANCTLLFESPESLKDMAFLFMGEEVTIAYKEMQVTIDPQSALGGMTVKLIISAINESASEQGVHVAYKEGVLTVTGESEREQFLLTLDAENGNILKLSIPAEEIEIEFFNFTILS